jgi:hypothetical protein
MKPEDSAGAAWWRLSWGQRRELLRYARSGRRHPDGRLSRIAEAWAHEELRPKTRRERVATAVTLVVLGVIGGEALGGYVGGLIAGRRAARRIVCVYGADPGGATPDPRRVVHEVCTKGSAAAGTGQQQADETDAGTG